VQDPFVVGWEEWLALPELGLPAIKAKVDSGARTSALHASAITEVGSAERPRVRFDVHPIPGRADVVVTCTAEVVDRREVTSSNGDVERRYVIRTPVTIGSRTWPIEISLTNRETMSYRMLLGRQAIRDDMLVDPARSFHQPQLGYRVYGAGMRHEPSARPLTIAILSRRPENAGNRRLVRQAELRGHSVPVIDRRRISLFVATQDPAILFNGRPLDSIDAVVFRAGKSPSAFSLAIVRQMEWLGAYALNPADALARVGDPIVSRQMLARAGIAIPEIAVNPSDLDRKPGSLSEHRVADSVGALGSGPVLRFAVLGGRCLSAVERRPATSLDAAPDWQLTTAEPRGLQAAGEIAEAAARVVGLGLAAVDVVVARSGPVVVDVTANVSLSLFESLAKAAIAEAVIVHIEQVVAARTARS
jgi:ribosomal protein S6--L-glutamate ligase